MYNKGTSKIKDIRIEDMFWSMTGYTEGKLQIKHIYIPFPLHGTLKKTISIVNYQYITRVYRHIEGRKKLGLAQRHQPMIQVILIHMHVYRYR